MSPSISCCLRRQHDTTAQRQTVKVSPQKYNVQGLPHLLGLLLLHANVHFGRRKDRKIGFPKKGRRKAVPSTFVMVKTDMRMASGSDPIWRYCPPHCSSPLARIWGCNTTHPHGLPGSLWFTRAWHRLLVNSSYRSIDLREMSLHF